MGTTSSSLSAAAVGAGLAVLVDVVEHEAHLGDPDRRAAPGRGRRAVYLLVISGLHSLADRSLATALPAPASWWSRSGWSALLGLEPGTSVLLIGLALALSLADYVRRTNRSRRSRSAR